MDEFMYGDAFTEKEFERICSDTSGTPHGIALALVEQLRAARVEIDRLNRPGRIVRMANRIFAGKVL